MVGSSGLQSPTRVSYDLRYHPSPSTVCGVASRETPNRRTSPLGCPASSLLSADRSRLFAGKYPVLDQLMDPRGLAAEVLVSGNKAALVRERQPVQAIWAAEKIPAWLD